MSDPPGTSSFRVAPERLLLLEEIPGRVDAVRLARRFVYYAGALRTFEVPAGFETDLASVPRALWAVFPPWGRWTRAAVVHDWLYVSQEVSRAEADEVFLRIMGQEGVGWRRRPMFWAVRAFGWIPWRRRRRLREAPRK